MVTPTFNPAQCLWGYYPSVGKPTIRRGDTGGEVGYMKGVLKCESAQDVNVEPNPGPWVFGSKAEKALKNFQTFWGLTADGVCGPITWSYIDWASQGFPT